MNCPVCFEEINKPVDNDYFYIEFFEPLDARKESYHKTNFLVCEKCFNMIKKYLSNDKIQICSDNHIKVFSDIVFEPGSCLDMLFDEYYLSTLNLIALICGESVKNNEVKNNEKDTNTL